MVRILLALLAGTAILPLLQEPRPGYTDTPVLPGMDWHVHDPDRPYPAEVAPGTAGAPPADAIVLFDGDDLDAWAGLDGEASWAVEGGTMAPNRSGDLRTREVFGDCQLHLEFRCPPEEDGGGQGRGNSGVFLMDRYELQVLDSFRNPTYPDGQAAALYGQYPPLVNASRPAGEWQSFDVVFRAPRFDPSGELLAPARITVLHNGVVVHADRAFLGPTRHRTLPGYEPHPAKAPLRLQDHGDAVRYRNLWIRPLDPEQIAKRPR